MYKWNKLYTVIIIINITYIIFFNIVTNLFA